MWREGRRRILVSSMDKAAEGKVGAEDTGGTEAEGEKTGFWETDNGKILQISLPAVLNNMIIPLVGAVDTFWVGRMGVALALAGQSAANQVFSTAIFLINFLPSVIAPLVAKAEAEGKREEVQKRIGEALFISMTTGVLGMVLLAGMPDLMLKLVLPEGAPARTFATPYLAVRGLSYIPAAVGSVAFSAFRGILDVATPLKISAATNIVNVILDPILIFTFKMGVAGAGLATGIAEVLAMGTYLWLMLRRKMVTVGRIVSPPEFKSLVPLLVAGSSVQLRAFVLQIAFVSVVRCVQAMDFTGTAAAAHAITVQLWQIAGIVLFGFGSAASILVPRALVSSKRSGLEMTYKLINWGWVMGLGLGGIQLLTIPLLSVMSPLVEVQEAAKVPAMIASGMQVLSGIVFVGEGAMMGYQAWTTLAFSSVMGVTGMMIVLHKFSHSLIGVWSSFCVFNFIRLLFVLYHVFYHRNQVLAEEKEKLGGSSGGGGA